MTGLGPIWLLDEFRAFERALALRTAIEMDLFTRIAAGANTIRTLAAAVHASERGLGALCDYLAVQGHLLKRGARYSLSLNARLYLTATSPAYLGCAAKFLAGDATVAAFCGLRQTVERGAGSADLDWLEYARSMAPLARPVAEFAATELKVDSDSAGPIQVLDIAAGHGLYGIAIAAQNPAAHVFALDSTEVLEVAIENARQAGVAGRYHPIHGDAFQASIGAALKPAGRIALIDFILNADRVSPAPDASFALTLLATSARGRVYTFQEYSQMLRAAGFRHVRHLKTGDYGRWMITASR
jgi:hypothetical protein